MRREAQRAKKKKKIEKKLWQQLQQDAPRRTSGAFFWKRNFQLEFLGSRGSYVTLVVSRAQWRHFRRPRRCYSTPQRPVQVEILRCEWHRARSIRAGGTAGAHTSTATEQRYTVSTYRFAVCWTTLTTLGVHSSRSRYS